MVDADAFAEWVLAKSEKAGALLTTENLERAKRAVALALDRPGDEVRVACTFDGARGAAAVSCDEHLTRMAVEVLFPKVTAVPHAASIELRDDRRKEPSRSHASRQPPAKDDGRERAREDRRIVIIVLAVFVCVFVAAAIAVAIKEAHRDDEGPTRHEKRESNHGH